MRWSTSFALSYCRAWGTVSYCWYCFCCFFWGLVDLIKILIMIKTQCAILKDIHKAFNAHVWWVSVRCSIDFQFDVRWFSYDDCNDIPSFCFFEWVFFKHQGSSRDAQAAARTPESAEILKRDQRTAWWMDEVIDGWMMNWWRDAWMDEATNRWIKC